ncbi:hypothetical protein GF318_00370 [Candidatus Micrarchaeota archaeon]|nr:hypothetical protein [Candidatus Micrarchaeota archaeon]
MACYGKSLVIGLLMLFLLANFAFAETTCEKKDCEITIKLKIAFQGANNTYINNAENEIESVWNGPGGHRTTGDCKCKMTFEVETTTAADCKNNPPAGYHCIMVTDFFKPDGTYDNPPRNQPNIQGAKIYMGYMYGVSTGNGGNSEKGWWSDLMSRPVNANQPQGEHYNDFAHEAGHMMGLEDGDGGIMSRTAGNNSDPTQANIDEIANDICGANACPKRCCCGNGKVDGGNVNEGCDPMAEPTGCGRGQACCPVCCNCFGPTCIPANGEYSSQEDCQSACGEGSGCYYNYPTGCWDCIKQTVAVEETCYDSENIRGNLECDHIVASLPEQGEGFYDGHLSAAPVIGGLFANERIQIETEEGDSAAITTRDGEVESYSDSFVGAEPTVMINTDQETIGLVASGEMSVQQALSQGWITIEGVGLVDGFRFGAYHFMFDVYNFFSPVPEFEAPEEERELPEEYRMYMEELNRAEPAPSDPEPADIGELPDEGYFGGEYYPEME